MASEAETPAVRRAWRIRGRVQGVGFRVFVARHARALGLSGYARNLPDGTVEVLAEGPPALLEQLARQLLFGPPGARVERIDELPAPSGSLPGGFVIR
ncbi:MAG: acylphosphatase [Firmicutes bacterium]|nr:acylphosphatase [Bacillota bacterium]